MGLGEYLSNPDVRSKIENPSLVPQTSLQIMLNHVLL